MRTDLAFFSTLVKSGSLTAAAREFDVTPSAVSKWLAQLESRLGVRLIARNTRRISVTNEGEAYLTEGRRILAEIDDLERTISSSRAEPVGLLKVNATLGFGRSFIAPAISKFSAQYPDLEIQLLLTSRPLSLAEGAADIGIRFGEPPDARVTARKIASHRRRIYASVRYLDERPTCRTISRTTTASSCGRTTWRTGNGISPGDGRLRPSKFVEPSAVTTARRFWSGH
jgi:LysR family transcriptional regulator, transcriptional activator for dmlA